MKVQIRRIGLEGMELTESFPVNLVELTENDDLKFILPFEVKANIIKADDEVFANLKVHSCLESFCCRCLEKVRQDWSKEFVLTYDAKEYKEFIEMDEDIRQELILSLPARILCTADCKGLCVDCGANLNKQECKHHHAVTS